MARRAEPDAQICSAFVRELLNASNVTAALQVFEMMGMRKVTRIPDVYAALLLHVDKMSRSDCLSVVCTLAASCTHVRIQFASLILTAVKTLLKQRQTDYFATAIALFDLLLSVALNAPNTESAIAVRAQLNANLWNEMLIACADRYQVVQAIALFETAAKFTRRRPTHVASLARAVCSTIDKFSVAPVQQQVVAWPSSTRYLHASPAEWFQGLVNLCASAPDSLACDNNTLKAIFSTAITHKWCAAAVPLVRVAQERITAQLNTEQANADALDDETYALMLRVVANSADTSLYKLARRILSAARDNQCVSTAIVEHFMSAMAMCGRYDKTLVLFDNLKLIQPPFEFSAAIGVHVLQAARRASKQNAYEQMKLAYVELVRLGMQPDSAIQQIMQSIPIGSGWLRSAARTARVLSSARVNPTVDAHNTRVLAAAAKGEFDKALQLLGTLPDHPGASDTIVAQFALVLEECSHQQSPASLQAIIDFAQRKRIVCTGDSVVTIVRLCQAMDKMDVAVSFVDSFEQAELAKNVPVSNLTTVRTELLHSLRDNGAKQMPVMIKLLNKFVSSGISDAGVYNIVISTGFRGAAFNTAWRLYRVMMQKATMLNSGLCANIIQEGVRFADELSTVLDDFAQRGVQLTAEVWTSAFVAIDKHIHSPAFAMQLFDRMRQQEAPTIAAVGAFNAALNCLDQTANVVTLLTSMRAAQVKKDSTSFQAVMRVCNRAKDVETAESTMLEFVYSDAEWSNGIFQTAFEATVGAARAMAFRSDHAKQISVRRKAARSDNVDNEDEQEQDVDGESNVKRARKSESTTTTTNKHAKSS